MLIIAEDCNARSSTVDEEIRHTSECSVYCIVLTYRAIGTQCKLMLSFELNIMVIIVGE